MSTYSAAVLALSPKRYYRLGETSGTVANDLGSDAQNGTIQAAGTGVTLNQASLILSDAANASMLFTPASAGYITLPTTSLPTGAGAWSVAAWVKMPATLPASGTFNTVWNFGTKSTNQFVELFYRGSTSHFEVDDWSGAVVTATTVPVGGGTYFLVVTYDGTTCKLYINGALDVSAAKTFNIVLTAAQIGNDQNADYWSGNIDEVAWFGSALTLAQIQGLYAAARVRTITASSALIATLTRTASATGAALATLTRTTPAVADLSLPVLSRTIVATADLQATSSRTIPASSALQATSSRTVLGSSALQATTTRTIGTITAALLSSGARTVPAVTALLSTATRTLAASVALSSVSTLAQDTFAGRSVTGSSTVSFGTASDGSAWGAPLSGVFNTIFGVASGEGFMYYDNLSGSSANGLAFLGNIALRDVDVTCRFKFGSVSGNPKFVLYVRGTNINNLTDVTINATTGAVVLERWSPGNNTTFAMGTFGALTAGSYYHLRIQSDGTTFRAKVWADGSSEPGSFPYTATDSFPARLVAGFFGVGVEGVTATTQATGVQFDNFVASLLYFNQQLYVATTGSDSTGTGASGAPFATIQHGLDAISPGGTLHVASGTYAQASGVQLTCAASGNAANRITLVSDVKWGAKITGTNSFTIFEVDGSYVDVIGFEVSATDTICSYGVVMQGNFVSVQRCFVHDIFAVNAGTLGGAGISGQNSGNNYLSGPVDVTSNFITRIGVDDTSVNSPYVHSIYMSNQGGNVQNNIVVGNVANAFQGGHGFSNMNISNNTFVGNTAGGVFIWNAGPGVATGVDDFTTIANNIIAYNTGVVNYAPVYGLWEYGVTAGINGPHNTYTNNLLFGNAVVPSGPYAGLQYEFDNTGVLVNSLFVDPQMVNYQQNGSGDYHLKPNSPAINAGLATNAPTTDYDGLTRPLLGANIDIGAYEATAVASFVPRALSALLMTATATRTVAVGGALAITNQRTIPASVALTGARVIPASVALQSTGSRTAATAVALIGTLTRTSGASGALQVTSTRTSTATSALSLTKARTATSQTALLATGTRTVPASSALIGTQTRSIAGSAALLATATRTIGTAASLSVGGRTVPCSTALLTTSTRTSLLSLALIATGIRTVGAGAALLQTSTRTSGGNVALLQTGSRTLGTTGAFQQTSTRSISTSAALGASRQVLVSAALLTTSTRTIGASTALQSTSVRTIGVSGAVLQSSTRTVAAAVALLQTGSRSLGTAAALLVTASRTVTESGALIQTRTRTVSATVSFSLLGTLTRTVPATVALSLAVRTVPAAGALLATPTRMIAASGAFQATRTRTALVSGALLSTGSRSIPATTALQASGIRTLPTSTALQQVRTRQVGSQVALSTTKVRSVPGSVALGISGIRTVGASGALSQSAVRVVPCLVALLGTTTRTVAVVASLSGGNTRVVACAVALQTTSGRAISSMVALVRIVPNANVLVRGGSASIEVRSGTVIMEVRSGKAAIIVE